MHVYNIRFALQYLCKVGNLYMLFKSQIIFFLIYLVILFIIHVYYIKYISINYIYILMLFTLYYNLKDICTLFESQLHLHLNTEFIYYACILHKK